MPLTLQILGAITCSLVLLAGTRYVHSTQALRTLVREHVEAPPIWPLVSVVVTARNEAGSVGPALASRLADDYPYLKIVFVDDRSDDRTTEEALTVADGDPRVRLLSIDELPEGWLGKVHALARGADAARAEWLLFSDADVQIERGALKRAVAYAIEHRMDLLALMPVYRTGSLPVDATWATFMRVLALAMHPAKIRDPDCAAAIGSGTFNLVRREALERTPRFGHIRMETGDDAALGRMVKSSGGSIELVDGRGCASVVVYRSVRELIRGIEKNGSTLCDRPYPILLAGFAAWLLIEFSPALLSIAWAAGLVPSWLGSLAVLAFGATTASHAHAVWRNGRTWLPGLAWPFGVCVLSYAVVRAVGLAHRQGGVWWRDTFYPMKLLAEGRRYTL